MCIRDSDSTGILQQSIEYTTDLSLPFSKNNLVFEFVALEYSAPEKNTFKYYLEGIEEPWIHESIDNQARYLRLPHGQYHFNVKAANSDGIWNEAPNVLNIEIRPPWYKTKLAYALQVLLVGMIAWLILRARDARYRLKVQVDQEQKEAERLKEQNRLIGIEKDKNDKLLLNILPKETAAELIEKGSVTPKSFESATVLFTDIVNFTKQASNITPEHLLEELNYIFSNFDLIVKKHNVEKIKTIGDAYMAIAGVPQKTDNHAAECINAALEINAFLKAYSEKKKAKNQLYFEIRLGIHSGPLVSGVVGQSKFQYDVWGDTVNIASRMESNSLPYHVNISKSTYDLVKDNVNFKFINRGKIAAKGKGDIVMYFVEKA